jgi:predicted Zn-dependent peptidase
MLKAEKFNLKNGLRVIVIPMKDTPSVTTAVWAKTGSRNEDRKVKGISHFLEHIGC